MQDNEKKQITDIVNAFRLLNKDIRGSFKIMCDELKAKNGFEEWKKKEGRVNQAKEDYQDYTNLCDGNDWYYLNCYGKYKKKIIGFTFVISIDYDKEGDLEYSDFIDQLDKSINKNAPMLCIFGTYEPIFQDNIDNTKLDQYVDAILQFEGTGGYKNYEKEKIKYNKWIDVEVDYKDGEKIKDGYEGWYKRAKVKIKHITDISSKEEAHKIIDELIKCKI